jgi:hypothetical protein
MKPIEFYDMWQLRIKQNFIVNFRRRATYLALDLVQGPVHVAERNSSPATTSNNHNSH